ncbi:MAG: hypothetical protein JNM95_02560 [Chitinophagaceae bacterium]|nr:hypothetical protein [Chitinophagaceae bacterium]
MKTAYATSFISCYKLGLLTTNEKKGIPYSTRRNWRLRKMDAIVGLDWEIKNYSQDDVL